MAIYSVRLGSAITTAAGTTSLYTCPAGIVTVIRDVIVINVGGAAVAANLTIGGVAYLWSNGSLGAGASFYWSGRQVMRAGEVIDLVVAAANVSCIVSGYQLTP